MPSYLLVDVHTPPCPGISALPAFAVGVIRFRFDVMLRALLGESVYYGSRRRHPSCSFPLVQVIQLHRLLNGIQARRGPFLETAPKPQY